MSKDKKVNLKKSFARMLAMVWFFPLIIMSAVLICFMYKRNIELIDNNIIATTEKSAELFMLQLEDIESSSKSASYYSDIRESYYLFLQNDFYSALSNSIDTFLAKQYKYNSNCRLAYLAFVDDPDNVFYTCNYSAGGKYKDVQYYKDNINDLLMSTYSPALDTSIDLYFSDEHLYLIRNIMSTDFKPLALLTLEINGDSLMESIEGIYGCEGVNVFYDGKLILNNMEEGESITSALNISEIGFNDCKVINDKGKVAIYRIERNKHTYDFVVKIKNNIVKDSIKSIAFVAAMLLFIMIPFIIFAGIFFSKNVTRPVNEMVDGYDHIMGRDYGYEIKEYANSEEILYMQQSFNHMSLTLKEQFERIFNEEIALRDSRIMALQSQINPHFLNNTLEIINWEARLNENYKVSSMIEALSTMLEGTMNRKNEQMISIREEMAYVDAYLYIIAQRMGDSFECVKEVDETLLDEKIPRLIIQPIVENAVDHGLVGAKKNRIEIKLYRENSLIHVDIINNSKLKDEDREKINHLLYDDIDEQSERRVSLGIRNVDKRVKLMYGDDCGLFIYNNDDDYTVSTILLKKYKER